MPKLGHDPLSRTLKERLADVPRIGRVTWIGVRPAHGDPMLELESVDAIAGRGLSGDRVAKGRPGGKRQVTLIQAEHLPVIGAFVGRPAIEPALLRRNLAIAGINLVALTKLRFAIGDEVVLAGTGSCDPCSKMDAALGEGGFQAMRGHGGITAQVEQGGRIRIGDLVRVLGPKPM